MVTSVNTPIAQAPGLGGDLFSVLDSSDSPVSVLGRGSDIGARAIRNGNSRNNAMRGTNQPDIINGLGGNDIIKGLGGDDRLNGGAGNDKLYGGAGNDILNGGLGDDLVYGQAGNDVMILGSGNDKGYGGAGRDRINGGAGNDALYGGADSDTLTGGAGDDLLVGGGDVGSRDTLIGGAGKDTFYLLNPQGDIGYNQDGPIEDYALIKDFTLGQDKIVIEGFPSHYDLVPAQGGIGTALIYRGLEQDKHDTVAVLQGVELNPAYLELDTVFIYQA